jgi:hypothetical protein
MTYSVVRLMVTLVLEVWLPSLASLQLHCELPLGADREAVNLDWDISHNRVLYSFLRRERV